MNQTEKRLFLIRSLLDEQPRYRGMEIPHIEAEQKRMLRSLFNIRMPGEISDGFLSVQDEYLREETKRKGVTALAGLTPADPGIYLWKGDITTLACDAVVNAANSGMTGCYQPCHNCIDNCIQPTGRAKITPAYNLPCKYVIHTVGPIVQGELTKQHEELLASCYRSCLELAERNGVKSIAFCCISTGVFGFPQRRAAEIAVKTVKDYREKTHSSIEVIFNVFKDEDYVIYRDLLG